MWKRWVQIWRICMLVMIGACFIWFVFQTEQSGYLFVMVCLLFAVLFCGYRFGSGMGAVAGSICGVCLAIWNGEFAQIGLLSVLGVAAGTFRKLGRAASVTAYLAIAFGIGFLYSPEFLFEWMMAVIFGGLVFLILPKALTSPQEERVHLQTLHYRVTESPLEEQIGQAGEAFGSLAGYFADENLAKLIRERDDEREWREEYLELRMLFAEQMMECAQMMEGIGQLLGESASLPEEIQKKLTERLEKIGVCVERIIVSRGGTKRGDLFLLMYSISERCVTLKLVCDAVSEVLGRTMHTRPNQPTIVSKTPRMIQLIEEPAYFMLHGVAQSKKDGSDFTGDSFSFLTLDDGQAMFFLCDGMGSGEQAKQESSRVTELAEQLCRAGFSSQTIVRLINNALLVQGRERPVTIDMGRMDLYSGLCDFTKSGASVTFICRKETVEELTGDSLPVGILRESAPVERLIRLKSGDIIVMMTDGVLEALPGMEKEAQMKEFCLENRSENPKEFASKLLRYVQGFGNAGDDMTVLVAGIWKRG